MVKLIGSLVNLVQEGITGTIEIVKGERPLDASPVKALLGAPVVLVMGVGTVAVSAVTLGATYTPVDEFNWERIEEKEKISNKTANGIKDLIQKEKNRKTKNINSILYTIGKFL